MFKGQFECLAENTDKYITFSIPIKKKVTKICKDGDESVVSISYKVKFIKDCQCFLEYKKTKDNLIKCKCLSCNKAYSNKIDEELKKRFKNIFNFSNYDIDKFILLL